MTEARVYNTSYQETHNGEYDDVAMLIYPEDEDQTLLAEAARKIAATADFAATHMLGSEGQYWRVLPTSNQKQNFPDLKGPSFIVRYEEPEKALTTLVQTLVQIAGTDHLIILAEPYVVFPRP
ncbi:MAG TPA: hypothetical protein VJL83_01050 [Patescibacteria group bacterium]|nr:hypothetical protein [Patescibacteria group bacterium]